MAVRDQVWQRNLNSMAHEFLNQGPLKLSTDKELLPTGSGVYMFSSEDDRVCYYVGKAANIQGRIFNGHLSRSKRKDKNGQKMNYYYKAPLKNALLGWSNAGVLQGGPECLTEDEAHDLVLNKLNVRYMEIENKRLRGLFEYYLTSVMNAKHAIDKDE
ncbi:hypothetical protein PAEAM_56700 [Paenibacillus sp. GM1FR]|uniref:GIY-YIG nuclease family protein n=1 Tax=Paenibacillus sp. GM1FR TaxID=2059267 RepID=UPI000C2742EB|nr:GIY-YIG nuclease family protein [Paenibacillus sp. GM1FR]PJN48808.1 hypothetical protein PAEAM_56700 [Paenibacillus sp. GM1FR]